jgi:endonuclease/exonuclease/phosphatase family metal-dependent hydrolase
MMFDTQCRKLHVSQHGVLCSIVAIALSAAMPLTATSSDALRVMTYNVWVGGDGAGPLSQTVGVIQTADADVVGIQEGSGNAQAIADALGYFCYDIDGDNAILSRFPIVQTYAYGAKIQLSPSLQAYAFGVHLAPYPYQPYDIRDGLLPTEAQAINAAQQTRGGAISSVLNSMSSALATDAPVFLLGDFNEPSHLDWTQDAANAGLHFGRKVNWPASRAVANAGMIDGFRALRPDEVGDPGDTWTPGTPLGNGGRHFDAGEVHDRIDFVYYAGLNVLPTSAQIYGYDANDGSTDIAIQPYPSDHRSVVVEFDMPSCVVLGDLTGNCVVNSGDWVQFRTNQQANMTGLTQSQAYAKGDMNGDFKNNHADFVIFKAAYEDANGAGSFANMLNSVPEPATTAILAWTTVAWFRGRRRD